MLWVVQEGGHSHGGVEHQALVGSRDLALPQCLGFGLPLSDGRREGGALVGLLPGQRAGRLRYTKGGMVHRPRENYQASGGFVIHRIVE